MLTFAPRDKEKGSGGKISLTHVHTELCNIVRFDLKLNRSPQEYPHF